MDISYKSVFVSGYEVLLDNDDYLKFKDNIIGVYKAAKQFYVHTDSGYLHRIITKCPKDKVVDHLNRNSIDNRRSNLKICTHQQNLWNQGLRPNNKTGIKGVSINSNKKNRYSAIIKVNYKKIFLGNYKTIKEAAAARLEAEKLYYGS